MCLHDYPMKTLAKSEVKSELVHAERRYYGIIAHLWLGR